MVRASLRVRVQPRAVSPPASPARIISALPASSGAANRSRAEPEARAFTPCKGSMPASRTRSACIARATSTRAATSAVPSAGGGRAMSAAVTSGVGVMPAFEGTLSEEEIETVSAYVAEVAGNGG